ncbi:MAG TPA: bifunctional glutamate N-acetyltransferase/amino-acid acetyltransferase ArgJ [Gemmataceae bacterium]
MSERVLADGYRFAGVRCGVREPASERKDLALVVSDRPAAAAGVFTQNRVVAAPVRLCRERLPRPDARAVVVCAGNANACTGERGLADARRMAELTARGLGCSPGQVLVGSTGVIGRPLPMPALEKGIPDAVGRLAATPQAFDDAANAILTTDTRTKVSTRPFTLSAGTYRLTGFAKGAAMIGPNMATLLAFLLTDAPVRPDDLHATLRAAADATFNCISVEGHTSTNDTVLLLANGTGAPLAGDDLAAFGREVTAACAELARAIAADAEGATRLVVVEVDGCRDDAEARKIAKAVADSPLVKTAVFGHDPNWGRIVSAAGYAGVEFEEEDVSLWLGDLPLYQRGAPLPFDAGTASAYLKKNREVHLRLRFDLGSGRCTFYTCDLTAEYVRLNAEYTT